MFTSAFKALVLSSLQKENFRIPTVDIIVRAQNVSLSENHLKLVFI
jgi:hypothetical protein